MNTHDETIVLRNPKISKQQQKKHISEKAKLDQETDELKHNTVSQDISRLIIQGRNNKKTISTSNGGAS